MPRNDDEPSSEEKPRIWRTEGGDLDRPDKPDIVGDDKADLSRMADDEIAKTEASTSTHANDKGARSTATNSIQLSSNGSLLGRQKSGAFNAVVSPTYNTTVHPQAQMFHHIAAAQQYYYNGLWNYGNRLPFASPHVASLTSPSLGSPSYGAAFNGVGVYPSPHSWLSAFQLDAAAKAGFTYTPLMMGVPAQMSPSFPSPMDHLHMNMALSARMESPSLFIPSPLHSPDTNTPIVTLGTKVPAPSLTALKLCLPNTGAAIGLGLSPTYASHHVAANHHHTAAANPLMSMRQILVPPVTTTVTGVASSSLNGVCNNNNNNNNISVNIGESRSTSDKQNSSSIDISGVKRSSTTQSNGHHQHHHHNSSASSASSSLHRQKETSTKKIHIKKPLNAFMLYMKEMRPNVMQEAGLKERQSAEINRILGRRWHSLTREEQQKYYEMAKKERQEHLRKYPSWSARDNYAVHKKKKRKRDKAQDNLEAKKCRARFGLDQQVKWCKHCRRKKKCLWFKDGDGDSNDAADGSPAAQVTSTSQFSSEDDVHNGAVRNSESSTTFTSKDGDINSPHSLVTSTTTNRQKKTSTKNVVDAASNEDDDDDSAASEAAASSSSDDDDDDHEMTYSDEENNDRASSSSPSKLPPKVEGINLESEKMTT